MMDTLKCIFRKNSAFLSMVGMMLFLSVDANALVTAPVAGELGFDAYNFIFVDLLGGFVGYIALAAGVIIAFMLVQKAAYVGAIVSIISATSVVNLDSFVTATGALI